MISVLRVERVERSKSLNGWEQCMSLFLIFALLICAGGKGGEGFTVWNARFRKRAILKS